MPPGSLTRHALAATTSAVAAAVLLAAHSAHAATAPAAFAAASTNQEFLDIAESFAQRSGILLVSGLILGVVAAVTFGGWLRHPHLRTFAGTTRAAQPDGGGGGGGVLSDLLPPPPVASPATVTVGADRVPGHGLSTYLVWTWWLSAVAYLGYAGFTAYSGRAGIRAVAGTSSILVDTAGPVRRDLIEAAALRAEHALQAVADPVSALLLALAVTSHIYVIVRFTRLAHTSGIVEPR